MHFKMSALAVLTLVTSLLLSSFSPLLSKVAAAPPSLSCTVDIIKVNDGYSLPYKNDGYYLDNTMARLLPGDTFIYSFKLFTGDSQQQGKIQKVTAQQIEGANEPISILAANTAQGVSCNIDSEKKVICNLDYSFTDSSYNPVYLLMKVDKKPAFTKTSTLFSIETDLGTTSCASYIQFNEPETPQQTESGLNIQTYGLSFESEPVSKWWPTAPNTVQLITAAVWKDSDGDNVKNLTNVRSEWQVDPDFLEITNTSSSYHSKCSVPNAEGRPCLQFEAQVITKKPGDSYVTLHVTDDNTGKKVWNSYPLKIYSLSSPEPYPSASTYPSQTPVPQASVWPSHTPVPQPSFVPENQVSRQQFEDVKQDVVYLQKQLAQQEQELTQTKSLLQKILGFFERMFRFRI